MRYRTRQDIAVGDRVRCTREIASMGSWPRYKDKIGTVVRVNEYAGEVGVEIKGAVVWFLPEEIMPVRSASTD